jgi:hypothetical protein
LLDTQYGNVWSNIDASALVINKSFLQEVAATRKNKAAGSKKKIFFIETNLQ